MEWKPRFVRQRFGQTLCRYAEMEEAASAWMLGFAYAFYGAVTDEALYPTYDKASLWVEKSFSVFLRASPWLGASTPCRGPWLIFFSSFLIEKSPKIAYNTPCRYLVRSFYSCIPAYNNATVLIGVCFRSATVCVRWPRATCPRFFVFVRLSLCLRYKIFPNLLV
jgi:hypothetical protein